MKVKCINKDASFLRNYEYEKIENKDVFGRFGTSAYGTFDEITLGKHYRVMGIIVFQTYQAYLIDDEGMISACPCQLFEAINDSVPSNWKYRLISKNEEIYPFVQAVFGYPELCNDKNAYDDLIVEKTEKSEKVYFRRKLEYENIKKY